MDHTYDGGTAFPFYNPPRDSEHRQPGLSKRDLFAAILMHSEAVTCGVPGEACDALVAASQAAGTDVIDHMAMNAVQGADALLRALAEPPPEPAPRFPEFNVYGARDSQKEALRSLHTRTWFDNLPDALRTYVTTAIDEMNRYESGEDSIPF